MTAGVSIRKHPPLMSVSEHLDPRRYPRVRPEGMIGVIRFAHTGAGDTYHFTGLDISQSGAAVLVAPDGKPLPSSEDEISIYVQRLALHRIPFRLVRTRRHGAYLEIGLAFEERLISLQEIQEIAAGCRNPVSRGVAGA